MSMIIIIYLNRATSILCRNSRCGRYTTKYDDPEIITVPLPVSKFSAVPCLYKVCFHTTEQSNIEIGHDAELEENHFASWYLCAYQYYLPR